MSILTTKKFTILELVQQIKSYEFLIRDIEAEIAGKESVLNGAYKDIKKGHEHYEHKGDMLSQLSFDRVDLEKKKKKWEEFSDKLANELKNI